MRKFLLGLIIGAVVAFHIGINFGRHKPLLSNPYERDVVERVKEGAEKAVDTTRNAIHHATEPARKAVQKRLEQ
jgi:hypothetical protein